MYYYRGIVIDTGCAHTAKELYEFLRKKDVKAVLITHYHEDHIGGAKLLQKLTKIYAPKASLHLMRNPPEIPEYRKIVWGQPEGFEAESLDDFDDAEIIETPGHSFDHVCFLIDGKLFSGDLVVSTNQIICMREENYVKVIESLRKVLGYEFNEVFGCTGFARRKLVEDYLNYLLKLKKRVEELYNRGKSIDEIVKELFPNPPEKVLIMERVSGKEWARENFVRSLLG